MKYHNLLIDTANLYYRAYFSTQMTTINTAQGQMPTHGIHTSIKMIQKLERDFLYSNGVIYFLFDNTSSGETRRKDLDPEYKMNRNKQEPGFYRGLDFLQLLLTHYADGWQIVQYPDYEADDLVKPLLKIIPEDQKIGLVTNDMDWGRAINDRCTWIVYERHNGIRGYQEINADVFAMRFCFKPSLKNICLYKSICGDDGDNIPAAVEYIPKKVVVSFLDLVDSAEDLFIKLPALHMSDHWKHQIQNNKGRILLNYSMVDYQDISVIECQSVTVMTKYDPRVLERLYKLLKFDIEKLDARVIKSMKQFEKPATGDDFFQFAEYERA